MGNKEFRRLKIITFLVKWQTNGSRLRLNHGQIPELLSL
jgi:hypothetical protein